MTQAGDPVDYVLAGKEEFTIRSSGTVIIEARRDATVTVEAVQQAGGLLRNLCPYLVPARSTYAR